MTNSIYIRFTHAGRSLFNRRSWTGIVEKICTPWPYSYVQHIEDGTDIFPLSEIYQLSADRKAPESGDDLTLVVSKIEHYLSFIHQTGQRTLLLQRSE